MKKFLISTPGRTASTSFFNYIERSLLETSLTVAAVDRGQYSSEEWDQFNRAESAVFTNFNPFHISNILSAIDPKEWCLIILTRNDFASWLLSINALNATNKWHPGKDYIADSLHFEQDSFMSSYWYYRCWQRIIDRNADALGFGQVMRIDFDTLIQDWSSIGSKFGWTWTPDDTLMKMGMTTSWDSVTNLEEVLTWIPDEYIITQIVNSI